MLSAVHGQPLSNDLLRIVSATHHDPFEVLGKHPLAIPTTTANTVVRVFLPGARNASVVLDDGQLQALTRIEGTDFFEWHGLSIQLKNHYKIHWLDRNNQSRTEYDPYCFAPQLGELDMHLFNEGQHWNIYEDRKSVV